MKRCWLIETSKLSSGLRMVHADRTFMKALSVRQPEAWLIVNGYKDVENRSRVTNIRGLIAIHASKKVMTKADREYLSTVCKALEIPIPDDLQYGGIVGVAEITDCVTESDSDWFSGPYGYVLGAFSPVEFLPCKGALGFFDSPIDFQEEI